MLPQEAEEKKEKLEQLFFTPLNAFEIKNILGLTNTEYNKLLTIVKNDLGLPSSYKRNPRKFNKYSKNSYYIGKIINSENEIEIICYSPTKSGAEEKLNELKHTGDEFIIGKASDENMKKLISRDYYEKHQKWDKIMNKYKLPYHSFYKLLNEIKLERNNIHTRTTKTMRYIYQYNNKPLWEIRKSFNGKQKSYGVFNELDLAIIIRNYLESIDWNLKEKGDIS